MADTLAARGVPLRFYRQSLLLGVAMSTALAIEYANVKVWRELVRRAKLEPGDETNGDES